MTRQMDNNRPELASAPEPDRVGKKSWLEEAKERGRARIDAAERARVSPFGGLRETMGRARDTISRVVREVRGGVNTVREVAVALGEDENFRNETMARVGETIADRAEVYIKTAAIVGREFRDEWRVEGVRNRAVLEGVLGDVQERGQRIADRAEIIGTRFGVLVAGPMVESVVNVFGRIDRAQADVREWYNRAVARPRDTAGNIIMGIFRTPSVMLEGAYGAWLHSQEDRPERARRRSAGIEGIIGFLDKCKDKAHECWDDSDKYRTAADGIRYNQIDRAKKRAKILGKADRVRNETFGMSVGEQVQARAEARARVREGAASAPEQVDIVPVQPAEVAIVGEPNVGNAVVVEEQDVDGQWHEVPDQTVLAEPESVLQLKAPQPEAYTPKVPEFNAGSIVASGVVSNDGEVYIPGHGNVSRWGADTLYQGPLPPPSRPTTKLTRSN